MQEVSIYWVFCDVYNAFVRATGVLNIFHSWYALPVYFRIVQTYTEDNKQLLPWQL